MISPENPSIELEEDFDFPNVSSSILKRDLWKGLYASPLKFKEAVHLCEARGVLSAVRHRSRDAEKHGKCMLFLGDNLGRVLALAKGRCASKPLLRLLRRIAAE